MKTPDNYPMFASQDGEYGGAYSLITFKYGDLTEEQWDSVRAMGDYDRFEYITACINRDAEEQARILGEDI